MTKAVARRRRPILPQGSTAWLFAHEMRVSWRNLLARRGGGTRGTVIAVGMLLAVTAFAGVPLGLTARHVDIPMTRLAMIIVDLGMVMIGSLMLSQTLASAAESLYQRGDLDLLFSSPMDPRRTLTVRFLALALNVFLAFSILISPLFLPVALIGHPNWLAAYGVLAALALTSSALGLLLAMALFRVIGPRRTRAVAQAIAAVVGAAFFLGSQLRNILGGHRSGGLWNEAMSLARDPSFVLPTGADWPLRAIVGETLPLLAMLGGSAMLFFGVSAWLGRRFALDASIASGADAADVRHRARPMRFSTGAYSATLRKELRLLWRDAALISQVLLRVLYLMPLGFLLIHNAGMKQSLLLPGGAAGLAFLSGQVAGSLAWITISAEEAPALLVSAPTPGWTFLAAKLTAAFTPLAALLVPLLIALTVLSPLTGLAAALGCAGAAVASGLINVWYQKPGKRAEFRRRRGSSWFATLAEAIITGLIAAATGFAATGSIWGLVPAIVAGALLVGLRRTNAQITQTIQAAD
jgi:ABC-2 type transport system permease protein